jgi:ABC-type amino acid transport system permease subunit
MRFDMAGFGIAEVAVETQARSFVERLTIGLTPSQIVAVVAVFFVTLIGALLLAWALRRWNGRQSS